MSYNPEIHNRQSTRIKNYDYSSNGFYFVTIMCKNRNHLFGKIVDGNMILNNAGKIANECWLNIPNHFPNVILHEYIIMPNHVHGILQIKKLGVDYNQPLKHEFQKIIPHSLGSIVKGFKIGVTKWYRIQGKKEDVWQRNYHDFVIFDPATYSRIEHYIKNNPKNFKG